MLKLVYKALNVRENEESRVALMLGHGFFMGVFFATFTGPAETLFLNALGDNYINHGIFAAGFLGIFTTGIFAFFQSKISYGKLATLNLGFIFVITLALYSALSTVGDEYYNYVIFALFAMNGPVMAVFLLGFWGVFGRMFDLRQSKRIIGGIDTGQLTAAILGFFIMGLISERVTNIENYLLIGAASVLLSLVFLQLIIKRFDLEVVRIQEIKQHSTKLTSLFKNEYILLLSIFLALSVTSYLFIERTYLTVLNAQYSGREQELFRFIVWLKGSILILSFIFQTFFNDRIIANYGLKISLLILPSVLSLFVIATIVLGTLFGSDVGVTFNLLFLSVALSKLFVTFLRDAMENPAFKLYFMPLNKQVRFDIQTKVEGVVSEFAKAIAGGLILVLGLLAVFDLISYYYILIPIIAGWIYVTGKLYNKYRDKIKEKLESHENVGAGEESLIQKIFAGLERGLARIRSDKAIFYFKLMEKINPGYTGGINRLMENPNEEVRDFAQYKMNEIRGVSVSDHYVVKMQSKGESNGRQIIGRDDLAALLETGDISRRRIARLGRSSDQQDRQYAAELIGNSTDRDTLSNLLELLRDIDPKVRVAAIKSAEKRNNHEVLNALIANLNDPRYSNLATNALVIIGLDTLDVLDTAFYKTGQDFQVMLKVIHIIGRIGGARAKQILWTKIDYPDFVLASGVLIALGECGFMADMNQMTRIKYAIEEDIEDIAWNLAAYNEVPNTLDGQVLKEAIKQENKYDTEHIYMLLSMLYEQRFINLVKENIESGTNEGSTYAIELLDVFLSEDLKQKVIPVLDDISEQEKVKKLEIFFPRGSFSPQEVSKMLINRDFTQTNRWSKACALHMLGTSKIQEYSFDMIANLFNPDDLVLETAAWSLYQVDPALYEEHTERLSHQRKRALDLVIKPRKKDNEFYRSLKYDKTRFLSNIWEPEIISKKRGVDYVLGGRIHWRNLRG